MAKVFLIVIFSSFVFPQSKYVEIKWKDLENVSFEESYLKEYNDWFLIPTFGEAIHDLDNQKVIIKGYVIPLDLDGKEYALSAYPFSSCFFCGAAGPESVMTLSFNDQDARSYKTDQVARFEGKLTLNANNPEEFIYVLESAVEIEK